MRKPLDNLQEAERFLQNRMTPEEKENFAVRLLTDAALYEEVVLQQQSYQLIRYTGRLERKNLLEQMHVQLMQEPTFNAIVQEIFF